MIPAPAVSIDLAHVRANALAVRQLLKSGTQLYATVKADAYGLGIHRITNILNDLVDGWYVFSLAEAVIADLWNRTGKPTFALDPVKSADVEDYTRAHVHPAVWTVADARRLSAAAPILSVDTGMQRFAASGEELQRLLDANCCRQAMTHATRPEHVDRFLQSVAGHDLFLHAAGSSLLNNPSAHLNAVRPGLALYRGAVMVSFPLLEVRCTIGPIGYSGFHAPYVGVIPVGYAASLRAGPCMVNGRPQQILEVGMQSAFVSVHPSDKSGDTVLLLGGPLTEETIAHAWNTTPQEVLLRMSQM